MPPSIEAAVITAERPGGVSYLDETLDSIYMAGFNSIFVKIDGVLCDNFNVPEFSACPLDIISSGARLGIVPSFRETIFEMLLNKPDPGFVALFQDDIRVAKGLANWLPENLPIEAVYMLYCAAEREERYTRDPEGWQSVDLKNDDLMFLGACGVVMDTGTARAFISHRPPASTVRLGRALGEFCKATGVPMWVHSPSLIQHVGEISYRGPAPIRQAGKFCEDVADLC